MDGNIITFVKDNLYYVEHPLKFFGCSLLTRMTIIKLKNNKLLIHSPIPITPYPNLKKEIEELGEVKYVVAPNNYHWLYLKDFKKAFPNAVSYSSLKT